ncbi:MAG: hypothetical protein BWK80_58910 [Desulfobacteraceae bacterium IS3]|nr:MAG: hypothetical protein BWK80_58910 [Desulfobacteraceae bacterium IS3]
MRILLQNIHKHYGAVKANNGISLTVEPGTIHGILGENGAGKSTLMKILAGYIRKTGGAISLDNAPATYRTPAEASRLGIGMLYQEPLDFPLLSVLDNFMLGQKTETADFAEHLSVLSQKFNFTLRPDAPVRSLTVGERQQLEILRLLAMGIQVLILDEPTTGISGEQKERLFQALRKLASEGKSILLVSHKIEDVALLCDKITVLRHGTVTGEMNKPFDMIYLLEMMFGFPPDTPSPSDALPGKELLVMEQVSASGGRTGLKNCNILIREGEIVGLAGLTGSGQGLFLRAAAGIISLSHGEIWLRDMKMNGKDYHAFQKQRVVFVPTARMEEGLIPGLSIAEHFTLLERQKGLLLKEAASAEKAKQGIQKFRVVGSPETPVESLSGGNQQRLLLSFLPEEPALLLLEHPTRGLDVESAHWVWEHLQAYSEQNTAIIFSSSELDEILMVADRVLVFFEGSIIRDLKTEETSVHELAAAIAGRVS